MSERRFTGAESDIRHEQRNDKDGNATRTIYGYAAVFYNPAKPGTQYRLFGNMVERIMPGAFARAIREKQDVRGLINHDSSLVLGRTTSQTLRLSEDAIGLRYEIDLPETSYANDLWIVMQRQDVSGSSFQFRPVEGSTRWEKDNDKEVRNLTDLDLFDVGPVTFPAYTDATSGVRAASEADIDTVKRELEDYRRAANLRSRILRIMELETTRYTLTNPTH